MGAPLSCLSRTRRLWRASRRRMRLKWTQSRPWMCRRLSIARQGRIQTCPFIICKAHMPTPSIIRAPWRWWATQSKSRCHPTRRLNLSKLLSRLSRIQRRCNITFRERVLSSKTIFIRPMLLMRMRQITSEMRHWSSGKVYFSRIQTAMGLRVNKRYWLLLTAHTRTQLVVWASKRVLESP